MSWREWFLWFWAALLGLSLAFCSKPGHSRDNGQYADAPPDVRAWFRSVTSPSGVPCCDISDGFRTKYDFHSGTYWVPIEGSQVRVPPDTVVRNAGNPIGDAVVWYYMLDGHPIIRCFVPASEV